jgi:hypothetical protein
MIWFAIIFGGKNKNNDKHEITYIKLSNLSLRLSSNISLQI